MIMSDANTGKTTPLHLSAKDGNSFAVLTLLDGGADPHVRDENGKTALDIINEKLASVQKSDDNMREITQLQLTKEFLTQRTIPTSLKQQAESAIQANDVAWLEATIIRYRNKGTSFEKDTRNGKTLLHEAASQGQLEIVTYLLEKNYNPNAKDSNGITALHNAVAYGYVDVVKHLLETEITIKEGRNTQNVKANVFITDKNGKNALHYAAGNEKPEIMHLLLKKCTAFDVDTKDSNEKTPLYYAAKSEDVEIVRALLDKGANPNIEYTGTASEIKELLEQKTQEKQEKERKIIEEAKAAAEAETKAKQLSEENSQQKTMTPLSFSSDEEETTTDTLSEDSRDDSKDDASEYEEYSYFDLYGEYEEEVEDESAVNQDTPAPVATQEQSDSSENGKENDLKQSNESTPAKPAETPFAMFCQFWESVAEAIQNTVKSIRTSISGSLNEIGLFNSPKSDGLANTVQTDNKEMPNAEIGDSDSDDETPAPK